MKYVPKAITRTVGRTVLKAQKNSPTLLFAAGVVGFGATVVLACRGTMKVEDVLVRHEKEKLEIDRIKLPSGDEQREIRNLKIRTGVELGKLYAPAVLCGFVSVACLTKSHRILTERNATLTAAYVSLKQFLDEYRGRVRQEIGEDREKDVYYASTPVELVRDTPEGPQKYFGSRPTTVSPYSCVFDETKKGMFQDSYEFNEHYIKLQERLLTDKLRSDGYLFLNQVYNAFGVDHTAAGQICGWYIGHPDSDDFVEISIIPVHDYQGSLILDFNVAGVVVDMLGDNPVGDQVARKKTMDYMLRRKS